MKRTTWLLSIFCFIFILTAISYAQTYHVSIPDIEVPATQTQVTVPISVAENLTGNNITSYQGIITWDDNVIKYSGPDHSGTLTEPWGSSGWYANQSPGYLSFGQFVASPPLAGSGTIVNLIFNVAGNPGESTTIHFNNFYLNAYLANTTDGSVTIKADNYLLTMAVNPVEGGTTEPSVGDHSYEAGTIVTIIATSNAGYEFVNWTGDVADPNSQTTTVTMNSDKTVTANFQQITHTLTMAVNPVGSGTTNPPVGNHNYAEGTVVSITATPNAGYEFVNWTGDVANPNSPSTTVTMNSDKTVTANFEQITHTLTMAVNPAGSGTTNPSVGNQNYAEGTVVSITATSNAGYEFVNWTGDVANPNSPSTTVTMNSDKTVTANFQQITHTLTMAVNPAGSGTTNPPVGDHTYTEGTVVSITATPNAGYEFVNWTGDVADPNSQTTTVTMNSDKTVTANFQQITHTLTMAVNPTGSGTTNPPVGNHDYAEGTVVSITATPNTGYEFVNWTGDVANPNSPATTVTMNSDKTVTANFQQITHTLTMAVNPAGSGTTNPPVGDYTYAEGTVVSITATPNAGYEFVNWTGDVANPNSPSTTVTMNSDKTVTANFQPITHTLTMAVNPAGSGTTNPPVGSHNYAEGTVVMITATPNAGYEFVNWTGDVANPNSPSTTVTMNSDKTVTANFQQITHTLTMAVNPTGSGTTNPSVGSHNYAEGTVVSITATPNAGYEFVNWTGDVANPNSPSTTVTMNSDKTVTANFQPIIHTLTMAVNPAGSGTTNPPVGDHTYAEGTVVSITATPNAGYEFVNWTGDVANPNSPSTTVTMNSNKTVTANFQQITHTLTMAVNPAGSGTTNPPVGNHTYAEGTVVSITATPNAGYEFVNWTGDVANPNSPSTTVTMNSDKTVTANFQPITHTLTMAVNPTGSGTTNPSVGNHTYAEGTVVSITATPNAGYEFVNWTGNVANPNSQTTTVTMNSDKTVTANFQQITHTLTMAVNPAGSGTTNPSVGNHTYAEGTVVSIAATPNEGYAFLNWTGDVADPNSSTTTVTMNGDKTVTANFTQVTHTLTMAVNPAGGGTTNPPIGTHTYAEGAVVTITATPSAGYRFTNWTGDVADPNSSSTTVTMDEDKTVTANFELIPTYTLTMAVNPANGGTTTPSVGNHTYEDGTVVEISATPAAGYRFVNWTGDVANPNSPSTTVTMDENKTITANFELIPIYTLAMAVNPSNGGTTDPSIGVHTYQEGTVVQITATASEGFRFVNWTGDVANPNSSSTTVTMDADQEVTANFERIPDYTLTLTVNPEGSGTTDPLVGDHIYQEGTVVTITAVPNEGYAFINWTGDVANPNSATTTVTMDDDKTVTANFTQTTYTLTMMVAPENSGTTNPPIGAHSYAEGAIVAITAIPADGYRFVHWTGDVANPDSSATTVIIDADKAVTAHFELIPIYTLTMSVNPEDGGITEPAIGGHTYEEGAIVILTAQPYENYIFDSWSGDLTSSTNPDTIVMDSNKNITANFIEIVEIVSAPAMPFGATDGMRGQLLTFIADSAQSNLAHVVEYQFDWGDGNLSNWGTQPEQLLTNITRITSPNGMSGLPSSGNLLDHYSANTTGVTLSVSGGEFQGKRQAFYGAEPSSGTDADAVFNGVVSCTGTIFYVNEANSDLVLTLTGMIPEKEYNLVFYSNRGEYGWDQASLVTISDVFGFTNQSSAGVDDKGNPLFSGADDPSTRLPSDNTATGYIARFTNIKPGDNGKITLTISFDGNAGSEYKGKYASALMLQEVDGFTAYNDFAWGDSVQSHIYTTSGRYQVRARARCQLHPDIISEWSESLDIVIEGCQLVINNNPDNAGFVTKNPDQADYDYGTKVEVTSAANPGYQFNCWNGDATDTTNIKTIFLYADTTLVAHYLVMSGIEDNFKAMPTSFKLYQNFPNPFNPTTIINYEIGQVADGAVEVELNIYNSIGELVRTLVDEQKVQGRYSVEWDGRDNKGNIVSSGIYMARLLTNNQIFNLKMIFMK